MQPEEIGMIVLRLLAAVVGLYLIVSMVLAAIKTSVNGLDSTRRDRARLQRTMCCVGPAADRVVPDTGAARGR